MTGWIKLHKSLRDWGWKDSPKHMAVFIDLLLTAQYKSGEYRGVKMKPGQFTTSLEKISFRTGVSIQSIRTVLKDLKSTQEVTHSTTSKYTMISITNWEKYQGANTVSNKRSTNDQQTTNKRSTTTKKIRKKEDNKTSVVFNFLDADVQDWIHGVTDATKRKWLKTYEQNILSETIEKAYEWANSVDREIKSIGGTIGTFLKDKPKKGDNGLTPYELAVLNVRVIPDDEL